MIKSVPYIKQETKTDCGIACLLSIVKFYGYQVSREWLYKESGYELSGVSMYGLAIAAEKFGFKVEGKHGEIKHLCDCHMPLIAHTKVNEKSYHFVVIEQVWNHKIKIMDPASGTKIISDSYFKQITTNYYLLLYPTSRLKSIYLHPVISVGYTKFFSCHKGLVFWYAFFILFSLVLEFIALFQLKTFVNEALIVGSIHNVCQLFYVFLFLVLLQAFGKYILLKYQMYIETKLNQQLKLKFYQHLVTLPLSYYQIRESSMVFILLDDIEFLNSFVSKSGCMLLHDSILWLFLQVYMGYLSIIMCGILWLSHFMFTLLIFQKKKVIKHKYQQFYQENLKNQQLRQHIVHSIEMLKGLHLEKHYCQQIFHQEKQTEKYHHHLLIRKHSQEYLFFFLERSIYLTIIVATIYLYIQGKIQLSLTNFFLLEGFIMTTLKSYNTILFWYLEYQIAKESACRLNEFFNCQNELLLFHKLLVLPQKIKNIQIRHLSFYYGDKIILDHINLTIAAKDKVFLYGDSGSGKSTLVKLLARYYEPTEGYIQINRMNITHYNLDFFRNQVVYIGNKTMLLSGTIEETILLSRPFDKNKLDRVIEICGLKEMFQNKEYTLKSWLEEDGKNISSGERQRLLLAQGLYQDSQIYILDECLSMVDQKLEKQILKKLCSYYANKIIIYISHRLEQPDVFNRRILIKQGKCYEQTM